MNPAEERVLEQALERLLESEERRAARVDALVAALRQHASSTHSQREDALEEAPEASGMPARFPSTTASAPRRSASWRIRAAAAAAALFVAALGLWALFRRGAEEGAAPPAGARIVARVEPPARLFGAAGERRGASAALGEELASEAEAHAVLFPSGAALELAPWSLCALLEEGSRLIVGELRARGPLTLDLGFLEARLPEGAGLLAALRVSEDVFPDAEHAGLAFQAAAAPPPRRLWVAALPGAGAPIELRSPVAPGYQALLAPGEVRVFREDRPPSGPLALAEESDVRERLEALWPFQPGQQGSGPSYPTPEEIEKLFAYLAEDPARWAFFAEMVASDFAPGALPPFAQRTWLDLLCLRPTPPVVELARELHLLAPELFEPWHEVALAKAGASEFRRELAARVADPGADLEQGALAAAYLALAGDPAALDLLRRVEAREPALETLASSWMAAFVLERLDEPAPLAERLDELEARVREALDLRATTRAADLVLLAEFYLAERESPGELETLTWRAAMHVAKRRPEVRSAGEILAALKALKR